MQQKNETRRFVFRPPAERRLLLPVNTQRHTVQFETEAQTRHRWAENESQVMLLQPSLGVKVTMVTPCQHRSGSVTPLWRWWWGCFWAVVGCRAGCSCLLAVFVDVEGWTRLNGGQRVSNSASSCIFLPDESALLNLKQVRDPEASLWQTLLHLVSWQLQDAENEH